MHLHFNSFYFDSPRVRCLIQSLLHDVADGLTFRQDLGQMFRAQNVPKSRRGQEVSGVAENRSKQKPVQASIAKSHEIGRSVVIARLRLSRRRCMKEFETWSSSIWQMVVMRPRTNWSRLF